jgi:hypothetical protein
MTISQPPRTEAYLTERVLKSVARKAFREAHESAMETAGSVVMVKDGWLVRSYKDGTVEKLKKLPKLPARELTLD